MADPKDVISFEGTENLEQIFEKLPYKIDHALRVKILRRAARPVTRNLRRNATGSLRKAVSTKKGRSKTMPTLYAGSLYKRSMPDLWFKLYWKTFGTLENRDKSHDFSNARKPKSANWRGGIKPDRDLQNAVPNAVPEAEKLIETESANEVRKFLQKYAYKG